MFNSNQVNPMNQKLLYRVLGVLSFIVSLITYTMTAQPSVPFWDCGEFSAASMWQQVPHPPGAPLFLMVSKVFQVLIPFGDIGWRINMVSVFASAVTIWLLYLITVKVILNFKNQNDMTPGDYLAVYGSAFVGALAFNFSDTFWFNGVESEVYASSQLFVTIIVYLMMRWNEMADEPGHERYLLLIAYLMGLSTGVHLLALLTLFSIVLVVYFRKYTFSVKSFLSMGVIAVLTFFIIYPGIVKYIPALLGGHLPFKNELNEYTSQSDAFPYLVIIALIAVAYGFYYAHKNKMPIVKLSSLAFLLMVFGYTTYAQIMLRSHANPPMNENEPKNFVSLTSYLGRDQYGDQKMWPRRTDFQDQLKVELYNSKDSKGEYIYGEWIPPVGKPVQAKNSVYEVPSFEEVNTAGELNYMFKYQINHMFIRYFLWNFIGRASDVQDAPHAFMDKSDSDVLNYKNGYANIYPIRFFALPLLFGMIGLFFHFRKDPKMAFAYLTMFLVMGVLATLQQNQQDPQPRERDYFYTGAFFVFSMWIGVGAYALIDWLVKKKENAVLSGAVVVLSLILVPVNMAMGGWKMHSRAGNYLPFDYAYNMLQSVEKDAILFTNGDNDTFPVWWLQDVAGVRRDVRIVNLSLGNTLWYVNQLKNREPWGAKRIPLSFADNSLMCEEDDQQALKPTSGPAERVTIPVRSEILKQYTDDLEYIKNGKMEFTFVGRAKGSEEQGGPQQYSFMVNNKLVRDIVEQVKFERPVYFSITTGTEVYSGLERFLRSEGMAMKVCPVPAELLKSGRANEAVNDQCLLNNIDNTNEYSLTPKYGFKFRNLSNPDVYFDDVHRGYMGSYRQLYYKYAVYQLTERKNKAKAEKIMDAMNKYISLEQFPVHYDEEIQIARIYDECGASAKAKQYAQKSLNSCQDIIKNPKLRGNGGVRARIPSLSDEVLGQMGVFKIMSEAYTILGRYDEAKGALNQLIDMIKQSSADPSIAQYKNYIQRNLMDIAGRIYHIDSEMIDAVQRKSGKDAAVKLADEISDKYKKMNDPMFAQISQMIQEKSARLLGKAVPADTLASVAEADSAAPQTTTAQ
jgi:tetratricopeptide (TPR) repeat protein